MNEAVLRMCSLSVITLVVFGSLWLADSVQYGQQSASRMVATGLGSAQRATVNKGLLLVALPVERAASATLTRSISLR
jgi:hypothetical protein